MRPESITLAIFEKYSAEELATTAAAMAQAQSDLESVEIEKKSSDSVFKERINTHAAQVSELAHKYNKGGETAQIGCTIRYDIPTVGKKSYLRMDSEETVEVHDMSLQERQETLQFPLGSSSEEQQSPETGETPPPEPSRDADALSPPAAEITFKDIRAVANNLAKLKDGSRKIAIVEMQKSIATKLLVRGKVIGPDGRLEDVDSVETANKLATAWLEMALEEATETAGRAEEVTRICPYPGCILFAEHEGSHEFPPETISATDAAAPQPQPQKKTDKKLRKKRGFAPPPDEDEPGSPEARQ